MDLWSVKFLWPFFTIEAIALIIAVTGFYSARIRPGLLEGKKWSDVINSTLLFDFGFLLTAVVALAPLVLPLGLYYVISSKFNAS
jgi:hypothetical protein